MKAFVYLVIFFPALLFGQNIGIGTVTPAQKFAINGKLEIGDDTAAPSPGTIRFNSTNNDFEGWNGTQWLSLTFNQENIPKNQTPSLIDDSAYFGSVIKFNGPSAAISAPGSNDAGQVFIFNENMGCWGQQKTIDPFGTGIAAGDNFGHAMNYDSDWLVVGAYRHDSPVTDCGKVYVYSNDGNFTNFTTLTPSTPTVELFYGIDVSLDQNYIAVGCAGELNSTATAILGVVYLYEYNGTTWTEVSKITAPSGTMNTGFGQEVLLKNGLLFVSATNELVGGIKTGAVHVYRQSGPSLSYLTQLTPPGQPLNATFGNDLEFENQKLIVAAIHNPTNGISLSGAVYYYSYDNIQSTFSFKQMLSKPIGPNNISDRYGISVALSGDELLVGCEFANDYGENTGAVYLYNYDQGWQFEEEVKNPDKFFWDRYGAEVAMDGNNKAVGSPFEVANFNKGKVYFVIP